MPDQQVIDFVEHELKSHKVVVFGKSWCRFTKKARAALDQLIKDYTAIELDKREDGEEVQEYMKEKTGASSVPRVFIDGKFVGGGDDIEAAAGDGRLRKWLVDAKVL